MLLVPLFSTFAGGGQIKVISYVLILHELAQHFGVDKTVLDQQMVFAITRLVNACVLSVFPRYHHQILPLLILQSIVQQ